MIIKATDRQGFLKATKPPQVGDIDQYGNEIIQVTPKRIWVKVSQAYVDMINSERCSFIPGRYSADKEAWLWEPEAFVCKWNQVRRHPGWTAKGKS